MPSLIWCQCTWAEYHGSRVCWRWTGRREGKKKWRVGRALGQDTHKNLPLRPTSCSRATLPDGHRNSPNSLTCWEQSSQHWNPCGDTQRLCKLWFCFVSVFLSHQNHAWDCSLWIGFSLNPLFCCGLFCFSTFSLKVLLFLRGQLSD